MLKLCIIHILIIHKVNVNFRNFKEQRAGGSVGNVLKYAYKDQFLED